MAEKGKKNIKLHLNIGFIVFFVIVIYLLGYTIKYLGKDKLAVYEVSESGIFDQVNGVGMILRDEQVIKTDKEGYINGYVKDGSRVKVKGIVYTVDTTGKIQGYLEELLREKESANAEEKSKIFEDLRSFTESYNDNQFYEVEDARRTVNHDLMSYTDTILADNKEKLEEKYGTACYQEIASDQTGIVTFTSDGLEEIKIKDLTKELFNHKVRMRDLRTTKKEKKGTPVYRITTSQQWSIVLPLSSEDYSRIENLKKNEVNTVQVKICKDEFIQEVPFRCFKSNGMNYVQLTFSDYVQRYINERYLAVDLILAKGNGLKIPASSLVKKEVYRIPKEYLTEGSNSGTNNQVNLVVKDKKGVEKLKQVKVNILARNDDMVSIATDPFENGDVISDLKRGKTFNLLQKNSVYGVYGINKGYAVFEYVDITKRNEDYCIVNEETSAIELYDRIILNSNTIKENEIIY